MKKLNAAVFVALFLLCVRGYAQAPATATRGLSFQAGAGFSAGRTDFRTRWITGVSIFADADFAHHIGIEFNYHNTNFGTPDDVGEVTTLGGLRYRFDVRRYHPYIKALVGWGQFKEHAGYFPAETSSTYKVASFGGGLEIPLRHRLTVRAIDAEYQLWPHFPDNGLTPFVATTGVAYRF